MPKIRKKLTTFSKKKKKIIKNFVFWYKFSNIKNLHFFLACFPSYDKPSGNNFYGLQHAICLKCQSDKFFFVILAFCTIFEFFESRPRYSRHLTQILRLEGKQPLSKKLVIYHKFLKENNFRKFFFSNFFPKKKLVKIPIFLPKSLPITNSKFYWIFPFRRFLGFNHLTFGIPGFLHPPLK